MSDLKCVAGCNIFSYHEAIHHKDCPCYQDSLTKYNDDKIKSLEKAIAILGKSNGFYSEDKNWVSNSGKSGHGIGLLIYDTDMENISNTRTECRWAGGKTARSANREVKELLGEKEYARITGE